MRGSSVALATSTSGSRRGGWSCSTTDSRSRLTDPEYLRSQYADDERLRVRIETHARYSENREPFVPWVLRHVGAQPGQRLLDVGSGPGQFHEHLSGVRVVALDTSLGMLAKVRVPKVQADAQTLPLHDRSFDRVMCNHVLYHVPDIAQALREMRRVLRAGGRVVLTTNASDTMGALFDLYNEAARELGAPEDHTVGLRFSFDDVDLVRAVFPNARIELYRDAFVFPAAAPALAFVASGAASALASEVRASVLERLSQRITAIIARDGVFRVPKTSGCFVAEVT